MTDGLWDGNMSFLPGLPVFMTYHTHYLFICEIRARAEGHLGYHLSRPALRINHVKKSCYSFSAPAECSVIVEALNTAVSITICGVTIAENRLMILSQPPEGKMQTILHTTSARRRAAWFTVVLPCRIVFSSSEGLAKILLNRVRSSTSSSRSSMVAPRGG